VTSEDLTGDFAGEGLADGEPGRTWIRPQALLLTFCAVHVLGREEAVFSGSFVEVLARVDIGEHAARSTLARMTRRGLLMRHRRGKRVYFGLSPRAVAVLADGAERLWRQGAVNRGWDGHWTLLGFSLPETRRADRHLLRSRLLWAGFGMLQNGLWIAPSTVDVERVLGELDVVDHIRVFRGRALAPTDTAEMVRGIWDLESLAARYRQFLDRWDTPHPLPDAADDLTRQLLLLTEWLLLVRNDPHLPLEHLPADWPAVRAEHVAIRLRERFEAPARKIVEAIVDRITLPD
jgi:phenylacetic acid degradation operon negative regulatory protein